MKSVKSSNISCLFNTKWLWQLGMYYVSLYFQRACANPANGVYISQLVRYARICTSKVDFINILRALSLRLKQQGFETNLLLKSFNKFFNRHGLIVKKYEISNPSLNCTIVSLHYIIICFLDLCFICFLARVRAQFYFVRVHYLFINLRVHLVR